MANDKSFKIKNGLQAGRYLQTGGTETAGSEGITLAAASYDSVSFSTASGHKPSRFCTSSQTAQSVLLWGRQMKHCISTL